MKKSCSDDEPTVRTPEADPKRFLEAYLRGERREESFVELVEHFGGMVQASAFRRTGSRELAEEVTQTVFTILARKAPSLVRHPSLAGWVFQTTRLESSKAMRSESRRQNKHRSYAGEVEAMFSDDEQARWEEILPHLDEALDELSERDRRLVFGRFFEGKRFRQLAEECGCTEAASKMQIKRALDRLSSLIGSRGVTLSTTGLASGLAVQLIGAAPARAAAGLAANAMTGSSTVGAGTLLTNTILTMSATKQTLALGSILIALFAIPVVQQAAQAARLNRDLDVLETRRDELNSAALVSPREDSRAVLRSSSRTVREMLSVDAVELSGVQVLEQFQAAMASQDIVSMFKVLLPVLELELAAGEKLMDEISESEGYDRVKPMVLQLIASTLGQTAPKEMMERMRQAGTSVHSYGSLLATWAEKNPQEALAWFEAKRQSGELISKGALLNPEKTLFARLLEGVSRTDPQSAVALYLSEDDAELRAASIRTLQKAFPLDGGNREDQLRAILDAETDADNRLRLVTGALQKAGEDGRDFERGYSLLDAYISDPKERAHALSLMAMHESELPFGERADWLMGRIDEAEQERSIVQMIRGRSNMIELEEFRQVGVWIDRQEAGTVRDQSLNVYSDELAKKGAVRSSYERSEQIADPELRERAVMNAAEIWCGVNEAEARREIPAEVLERLSETLR